MTDSATATETAPPLTHSAILRTKLDLVLPQFLAVSAQVWRTPEPARLYPAYLCLMHEVIRASVPLMGAALRRSEELAEQGDAVARALVPYWRKHIREETGHDEWLRQDLEAIGHDPDLVWAAVPRPAVANLVGSAYYWLLHDHPASLLGYISVLEGSPPSERVAVLLSELTGYPIEGFRTLQRHSAVDVRHGAELFRVIDELPLDARQLTLMSTVALSTVRALVDLFASLADAFDAGAGRARVPVSRTVT